SKSNLAKVELKEKNMKTKTVLWLDNQKAYVVTMHDEEIKTSVIHSNVESKHRSTGGRKTRTPYGPQDKLSSNSYTRKRDNHLKKYYAEISNSISGAENLLILGPGESKIHLKKYLLEKPSFSSTKLIVENADKLTKNQLVAKIKKE